MTELKRPSPKARLIRAFIARPDPIQRLRSHRFGLDRLSRKSASLDLYFEAGDPHSHLCTQWLQQVLPRLRCPVRILPVAPAAPEDYPEGEKQHAYAVHDAAMIAPSLGLSFPLSGTRPSPERTQAAAAVLAAQSRDAKDFLRAEAQLFQDLFSAEGRHSLHAATAPAIQRQLDNNAKRRQARGHYLPAMWQYDGQWFWGLDRIPHLETALRADSALAGDEPLLRRDPTLAILPAALEKKDEALEFFFSFRSPYSYLAICQIAERAVSWSRPVQLRPVLPMAMRGMKISRNKRMYIVRDVYREALRLDIPFGLIADPIGAGAERCLRAFTLCQDRAQQLAFCLEASRAIWSQAIDVATDAGLAEVAKRAGLDPTEALAVQDDSSRLEIAEANRAALFSAGYWGVPSFVCGNFSTWGNDRIWLIDELMRRDAEL